MRGIIRGLSQIKLPRTGCGSPDPALLSLSRTHGNVVVHKLRFFRKEAWRRLFSSPFEARRRTIDLGWLTTRACVSDTPGSLRRWKTHLRRRSRLSNFPQAPLLKRACPESSGQPPSSILYSPAQAPSNAGLRYLHTAIFFPPAVIGMLGNPQLSAH